MFELPLWQVSTHVANWPGQWFAEAVATFGLLLTILGCVARTPAAVPYAVGLYITAAYWFTASTSFANPAVTIARSLPTPLPASLLQASGLYRRATCGMLAAVILARWFWRT